MLPLGRVVRGELLVGADQLPRQRMISRAARSGCRRARDRSRGRSRRRRTTPAASSSSSPGAAAISVAPFAENVSGSNPFRSVKRHDSSFVVGQRQRAVALEQVGSSHASNLRWSISAFPSGSLNHACLHTPVTIVSPSKTTPFDSSSARAASTSATRSANPRGAGREGLADAGRVEDVERHLADSEAPCRCRPRSRPRARASRRVELLRPLRGRVRRDQTRSRRARPACLRVVPSA